MHPAVRAFVWLLAIVSLGATLRYGLLYALSQPAPEGFDAMDLDKPARPRLVVVPVTGVDRVEDGQPVLWQPADGNGTRVARALFLVAWNASGGYDVPSANATGATNVTVGNVTWELPPTLGNGTGLFLADDRGGTPHAKGEPLLGSDRLEGVVARVEDGGRLLVLLAVAAGVSLVPLAILVATQRPKRAPEGGVWDPSLSPSPPSVPCVDCGRPVAPGATFCVGCGAYLRRPGDPPP